MKEVIQSQPDDASYEEIMRELAFERMIIRGLEDSRCGRVISNDDIKHQISLWPNISLLPACPGHAAFFRAHETRRFQK